jgi:alpha-D-xyloside xylohydrolase
MKRPIFKATMLVRIFLLALSLSALALFSGCASSDDSTADGDQLTDGDISDGDMSDGDINDGDISDGDTIDGDRDIDIEEDSENDNADGDEPTNQAELTDGTYSVSLDAEMLTLVLSEPERGELLRFEADSMILGLVDQAEDTVAYDPMPIVTNDPIYNPPESLHWVSPETMAIESATDKLVTVLVTYPDEVSATLKIEVLDDGNFRCELLPTQNAGKIAFYRLRATIDENEGLYGLGEYFDDVNSRGKIRAMQINFDLTIESGYNEMHIPIPFVTGSRGWGVFTESPYPGSFEVALGNEEVGDDVIQATFGVGVFAEDGFVFHLFAADHPLDVTKHYYDVTGYPVLPARWALGPWIWRDEINGGGLPYQGQELIEYDLATIREQDLACSGYWIDRPYARAVNSFDWDPQFFTDAQGVIDMAHDMGYRVAIWHTPYIDSKSEITADLHQTATDNGYYALENGLIANPWNSNLIDFTNPDAMNWWQDLLSFYTEMGIEGFKLDYAEDVIAGLYGARNVWKFFDGSDERTMHHFYQNGYHQAYAEMLPEDGGFLLCRASTYGDQINASVIWPGDLDANMALRGERIEGRCDDKGCTGGMPASMIAGITLGASGFPFYGSDTGGYRDGHPDKETFMRWMVQTALSSVMQVGTGSNDVPWEFREENGFDQEVLDAYRVFARLHLRLWPYEWTYAQQIATTGRPIQRAFGLQYPETNDHRWDEYFFGDDLLVAPVVQAGVVEREVAFPAGEWINWFSGEIHEGPTTITQAAPLGTLPLYMKKGGIVPLLRPTIDTLAPVAEELESDIDSYATTPGMLYPVIFPGDASSFELFDGALIGQEATETGLTLSSSDGSEFAHGVVFTVIGFGDTAPASVVDGETALPQQANQQELDSADSGWLYLAEQGGSLLVKIQSGSHQITVTR